MKNASTKRLFIILCIVMAMTAAFIFSNSLQGSEDSWDASNAVASLLDPILHRLYALSNKLFAISGHKNPYGYGAFVRKLAHFSEYCLFGIECTIAMAVLSKRVLSPYIWADLFAVLMVAVIDEFVQTFVGRTSLVSDVLIDFSGALVGILIALVVVGIVFRLNRGDSVPAAHMKHRRQ